MVIGYQKRYKAMIRRTGKGQTLWHKGSMPDPYNMIINRQPIIVNLQKKGKGHMESRYGIGNSPGTVLVSL